MHSRFLDSFSVGDVFVTRAATFTESEMVDFALKYDPQPMHIDAHGAAAGPFGGLIASGFHTLSLSFRLWADLGLFATTNIVGPGLDDVRWQKPVRPGDTVRSHCTVTEVAPSRSKPDRGILKVAFDVRNQHDETVLTYTIIAMLRRDTGTEG